MGAGFRRAWRRIRDLLVWQARDRDMRQEMQFHLDALAQEYVRGGMTEADARLAARRRFGSLLHIKERGHDVRGAGALEQAIREVRHAMRRLVRTPAFTLPAALTLALAIAANATLFAVVHAVVLNPLPYPQSGRLIQLEHGVPRIRVTAGLGMTAGLYYQYGDRARTLESVAVYRAGESTLVAGGEPERIRLVSATPSLMSVLQVPPALGRWFADDEGTPGGAPVAVLSHGLWIRRFGGNRGIVGRAVMLDGVSTEVIGVMPAAFGFPDARVDAWIPDRLSRAMGFGLPYSRSGVARLRSGASVEDARAELDAIIADLPNAYPGDLGVLGNVGPGGLRSAAVGLKALTIGSVTRALWTLLAAAGVVLLVACANVANLFLVRSEARQREVAVRRALGASGPGIARFFLAESALLSLAGALAGLAMAWGAVHALVALGPPTLPRLGEIRIDAAVAAFTLALSAFAGVAFGSIPLWRPSPLASPLQDSSRTTASPRRHRVRHLLMGAQVALALVLLVAAGLLARSFQNLRAFDPGFEAASTLTFRIGLPSGAYPTRDAAVAAHSAILDSLAAIPGVTNVSAASGLPLVPACFGNSIVVERRAPVDRTSPPVSLLCAVSGGYVDAMRMPLLRGRGVTRDDVERRQPNVVVNQAFVDRMFPDRDPIGERFRSNAPPPPTAQRDSAGGFVWEGAPPWLTIVGVVANTPFRALGEAVPVPAAYMPMSIAGGPDIPAIAMIGPDVSAMSYVVRSAAAPAGLLPSVRRAVASIDPGLAIAQERTLEDILADGAGQAAFMMVTITIAAGVALLLGLVGVYGVISYIVSQRTGEIGVRLALGAEPRRVAASIVRQSGMVAIAAIGAGVAVALAGSRLIDALLYNVSPRDPAILAATTVAVLAIALLACWIPARRAAQLNPVTALRSE